MGHLLFFTKNNENNKKNLKKFPLTILFTKLET